MNKKNIVVVGSSFAGLMTIKTLRREGCNAPITLVAPLPERFYHPAIIWVPAGLYKEHDLTFSLDGFFRRYRVDYISGSVTGLDAGEKRLRTTAGEMEYEQLVIATGGRSLKRLPGIEHTFIPCEGYGQMIAMMERLAILKEGTLAFGFSGNPNEPTAIRSEALFEFLFGIDTLLRRWKRRDRFNLVFFTSCPEPDMRWGIQGMGTLRREWERRCIHCHIGHKLNGFSVDQVMTEGGDVKSDLTVFIPEMIGPTWATQSDLPLSEDGFIRADAHCRVLGFEGNVYGAGDACHFPGPDWVPKQGHMADLHAQALARNLMGDLRGERTTHTFRQEFICIVDTLDGGILVFRDSAHNRVFRSKALHWAKRLFIWAYLYEYRNSR
ncbi:Sulfide-quinone reductase [Gammaproteobacteria bacterium]